MALQKQKLRLKLDRNRLICRRYDKEGNLPDKAQIWRIGKTSNAPRAVFHLILGYVRRRVSQSDEKSIEIVRKAVLRGLCEAATACGCHSSFGEEGGDVMWTLRGEPFFAFQIHEEFLDKKNAARLRKGETRLRWVVVIKKGGYVRFIPRKARRVSEPSNSH